MDEVGIETTIILTGATGAKFDQLVDLYLNADSSEENSLSVAM
jgi:hypothetical protein